MKCKECNKEYEEGTYEFCQVCQDKMNKYFEIQREIDNHLKELPGLLLEQNKYKGQGWK